MHFIDGRAETQTDGQENTFLPPFSSKAQNTLEKPYLKAYIKNAQNQVLGTEHLETYSVLRECSQSKTIRGIEEYSDASFNFEQFSREKK